MWIPIDHNNFRVYVDGFRRVDENIVFLSMFGPRNAVRAVWAHLVGSARPLVRIEDAHYRCQRAVGYEALSAQLDQGNIHSVILHSAVTSRVLLHTKNTDEVWILDEDPSRSFFDRLQRECHVPMRAEWAPILWERGNEEGLIHEGHGFGKYRLSRLELRADRWLSVVRGALSDGVIS